MKIENLGRMLLHKNPLSGRGYAFGAICLGHGVQFHNYQFEQMFVADNEKEIRGI